ncbi:MAG: hypothetical protein LBR45_05105 [Bacteroidales bacterium]|jgi:hypothetical protein|nr:hypothetical protein [Bacteroidales bacterium]
MKNILKLSILLLFAAAFFSCGKEATGDREISYSIVHSSGISIYSYTCDDQEIQTKMDRVRNYLYSFNRSFTIIGFGDYECDNKAKENFRQTMKSFTQQKLQAMLDNVFGDNIKGKVNVWYSVCVSGEEYFGEYLDETELYTAEVN